MGSSVLQGQCLLSLLAMVEVEPLDVGATYR
jgi:hypothetical protein